MKKSSYFVVKVLFKKINYSSKKKNYLPDGLIKQTVVEYLKGRFNKQTLYMN